MKRTLLHWSTHETRTNANNGKTKYRTHCGRWLLPTSITLHDSASEWVQKFPEKFCDRCKSRLSRFASQQVALDISPRSMSARPAWSMLEQRIFRASTAGSLIVRAEICK